MLSDDSKFFSFELIAITPIPLGLYFFANSTYLSCHFKTHGQVLHEKITNKPFSPFASVKEIFLPLISNIFTSSKGMLDPKSNSLACKLKLTKSANSVIKRIILSPITLLLVQPL